LHFSDLLVPLLYPANFHLLPLVAMSACAARALKTVVRALLLSLVKQAFNRTYLAAEVIAATVCDVVSTLPFELLERVLAILSQKEQIVAARVSRSWRAAISSIYSNKLIVQTQNLRSYFPTDKSGQLVHNIDSQGDAADRVIYKTVVAMRRDTMQLKNDMTAAQVFLGKIGGGSA
jgi:hypothetical protein